MLPYILLSCVLLAAALLLAVTYALMWCNAHPHRVPIHPFPSEYHIPFDEVSFNSTDGVPIAGWVMQHRGHTPWVVLCHGIGTNRSDMLRYARFLYRAGYSLLAFDFRMHGESGGHRVSFGLEEQRDLRGALAFLRREFGERRMPPIGVFGLSMGAAVALQVAPSAPEIAVIVADSSYRNLALSMSRHVTIMMGLPEFPFAWFARAAYRLQFGVDAAQVSPEAALRRTDRTAVMIISGGVDPRMSPRDAESLYESVRGPRELWLAPAADHVESFELHAKDYEQRVVEFFDRHLRGMWSERLKGLRTGQEDALL